MSALAWIARARGLARDRRGVSTIEFAFIAPFIGLFIVGVSDLSRGFAAKLSLEQAAYRGLEKVVVGTIQSDYTFVKTEAEAAAGTGSSAVVTNWLECDRGAPLDFAETCAEGQESARYVKVVVTKSFQPMFQYGKLMAKADANGNVVQTSTASVRVQ